MEGQVGHRLCPLGGGIAASCTRDCLVPPAHHFNLKSGARTSCLKWASLIFML